MWSTPEVVDQAPLGGQLGQAPARPVGVADHHGVLGHAEQERPGVGVARAQQGVDLERGPAGRRRVDADAVVDDALEHRQRPDAHTRVSSALASSHDGAVDADDPTPTPDDPGDAAALAAYAAALADGVERAIPRWVDRVGALGPRRPGHRGRRRRRGGHRRRRRPGHAPTAPRVRALLDDRRRRPARATRSPCCARWCPTRRPCCGRPAPGRWPATSSPCATSPTTPTTSAPATFADVDPALHEPGLVWGAAKAHVHLARRRAARAGGDP